MEKSIDYFKIGQNIRQLRKAKGLSQEELAEKIGISVTHMSHIETANTKLSLPVFLALSDVLNVRCDDLLKGKGRKYDDVISRIVRELGHMNEEQLLIMEDIIQSSIMILKKHDK